MSASIALALAGPLSAMAQNPQSAPTEIQGSLGESVGSSWRFLNRHSYSLQVRYRARRGQGTCPQDKPVYSRCAVRDLPTAPRVEAFGLTR